MFGPPGRLYVYRSYGIHVCANVVCEREGRAAAVLLRALEPVEGEAAMRAARGLAPGAPARGIANGPGNLTRALGITLEDYGRSLLRGPLELRRAPRGAPPVEVAVSRRIGLTNGAELPYRYFERGHPCVSRGAPGRAAGRTARAPEAAEP